MGRLLTEWSRIPTIIGPLLGLHKLPLFPMGRLLNTVIEALLCICLSINLMVSLVSNPDRRRGRRRCHRGSGGRPGGLSCPPRSAAGCMAPAAGRGAWTRNNTGPYLEARFQTPTMPRHTTYFEIFLQRLIFPQILHQHDLIQPSTTTVCQFSFM